MVEKLDDLKVLTQRIGSVDILLFDFDGTLVNTDYANFLSYKMAIEKVKKTKLYLTFKSGERVTREIIRMLVPSISEEDYMEIVKIKENLYPDYLHETKLKFMAASILDVFSDKERVLITNSRKERASMVLQWHQLIDKIDRCFYREDMASGINKFQSVLSNLRVSASSVVVFENDESEIEKAISEGIPTENIFRAAHNVT